MRIYCQMMKSARPSRSIAALSMAVCLISLSACQTTQVAPPAVNTSPGVHELITAAAERTRQFSQQMQNSQEPADFTGARMNVFWDGDAHEILSRLASARKLKFTVTGPKPRLDLPVHVKLYNVTAEEAIKNIGDQCGGKANVKFFDHEIVLEMKMY